MLINFVFGAEFIPIHIVYETVFVGVSWQIVYGVQDPPLGHPGESPQMTLTLRLIIFSEMQPMSHQELIVEMANVKKACITVGWTVEPEIDAAFLCGNEGDPVGYAAKNGETATTKVFLSLEIYGILRIVPYWNPSELTDDKRTMSSGTSSLKISPFRTSSLLML